MTTRPRGRNEQKNRPPLNAEAGCQHRAPIITCAHPKQSGAEPSAERKPPATIHRRPTVSRKQPPRPRSTVGQPSAGRTPPRPRPTAGETQPTNPRHRSYLPSISTVNMIGCSRSSTPPTDLYNPMAAILLRSVSTHACSQPIRLASESRVCKSCLATPRR